MKKDRIERFIRDNREEFDAFEPPLGMWAEIERRLPEPVFPSDEEKETKIIPLGTGADRKKRFFLDWRMAAGVVLLLGVGFFAGQYFVKPKNTDPIIAKVSPEEGKTAFRYASLIESKREEIRTIEQTDPTLYREFASEIERLDSDYQNLRSELPQTPNQEELVDAMIQNLQMQLDILNRQLQIINKIQQSKQSHEKTI
ncbi:hypothetical protein [Siphonobacter aquaeclarae]|jgi:hypothetical protein|uniref:Anti-sigma factor n=1 Tax=Siphonobacter aquaeclarae TaxID=563176 RepID=A0A1G9NCY7_9BACT|nr:hypothetical protein [Siphonobacter aquaeclarae]SDL83967.1 hypothetical protein SAMN04488090_1945 [Siphonobacter aquaeclarae]